MKNNTRQITMILVYVSKYIKSRPGFGGLWDIGTFFSDVRQHSDILFRWKHLYKLPITHATHNWLKTIVMYRHSSYFLCYCDGIYRRKRFILVEYRKTSNRSSQLLSEQVTSAPGLY